MEFLSNLFGNLAQGIIRLAVTVGILAAAYFFLVKPALDTTEEVSRNLSNGTNFSNLVGGSAPNSEELNRQIQATIRRANAEGLRRQRLANQLQIQIRRIQRRGNIGEIQRMSGCLRVAGPDLQRAVVCVRRIP